MKRKTKLEDSIHSLEATHENSDLIVQEQEKLSFLKAQFADWISEEEIR